MGIATPIRLGFLTVLTSALLWSAELYVSPAGSGTECTQSNPCDFQTALIVAANNSEDDTIYLKKNPSDLVDYRLSSPVYYSAEPSRGSLTIKPEDQNSIVSMSGDSNRDDVPDTKILVVYIRGSGSATVTIEGIKFLQGGSDTQPYSVLVRMDAGTVLIKNCDFSESYGGLWIDISGGEAIVEDSKFLGNFTEDLYGAGLRFTAPSGTASLTVKNSIFSINRALAGTSWTKGGGLYTSISVGSVTVVNSVFHGNHSIMGGSLCRYSWWKCYAS